MSSRLAATMLLGLGAFVGTSGVASESAHASPSSPNPPTTQPTQSGKARPSSAERDRWDRWTQTFAKSQGLDWHLAKAVRIKESFDDPYYVSTTGAVGLMQLMPPAPRRKIGGGRLHITQNYLHFLRARRSKGRRYRGKSSRAWGLAYQRELLALVRSSSAAKLATLDSRFDARWNLRRGVAHLARDWRRFRKRYPEATAAQLREMTLVAYYAGPGRVRFVGGRVKTPSYTKAYVADVLAVYARLRKGLPGR